MRKIFDQIIIGVLISAVVVAVIGLIAEIQVMASIAMWALMIASVAYGILQVKDYLDNMGDETKSKQLLVNMILTVVIVLAVLVISILTLSGKIF